MGKFDALFQMERGSLAGSQQGGPVPSATGDMQTAPGRGDQQPPAQEKDRRRARSMTPRRPTMVTGE